MPPRRLLGAIPLPLAFLLTAALLRAQSPIPTITSLQGTLGGNLPVYNAVTAGGNVSGNGFQLDVNGDFNSGSLVNVTVTNLNTNTSLVFGPPAFEIPCSSLCASYDDENLIIVAIPGSFYPDAGFVYQLQVTVQLSSGTSSPADFPVNPNLAAPSPPILPAGTVNVAYSQTFFSGGTSPVNVSLASGSMPPGLPLPATGNTLAGTPTAARVYQFSPLLTDAWGNTVTANEAIEIYAVPLLSGSPSPPSVGAGASSVTITLNGGNFTAPVTALGTVLPGTSVLVVYGALQPTVLTITPTILSSTQLQFTLAGTILQAPLTASISVQQPSGAGSSSLPFQVLAPTVTSPSSSTPVIRAATLTVTGANYVFNSSSSASQIVLNGAAVATTFVSPTTLTTAAPPVFGPNTVAVTNPGGSTSNVVTFQVVSTLQITTTSLPTPGYQAFYNALLAASGGTPPYTWTVTGLPAGLSYNAQTGAIFGAATATGTFTVSATVRDTYGANVTAQFAMNVPQPPPPVTFSTLPALPDATQFVPYSVTLAATGGSGGGYTFALSGSLLPPGLSLASSGSITGTPTTAGAFDFSVSVTDSSGNTGSQGFNLNIKPAPLQITTTGPFAAVVAGAAVSLSFAAIGGVPPYTFSATGLPPGTSMAANGALTGNPTQPSVYNFTVTVKDSVATTQSKSFALTVNPAALSIAGSLGNGVAGSPYSSSVSATGGVPPYTWSASGVPNGLTFSAGSLTGTPTTAGTFTVAVTVTDSASSVARQSFTVVIATAPLAITASLPNGTANAPYAATLTATGGTPPYTWSASGLPSGITANTSGAISGTPATPGTYTVAVTVTDANQQTVSQSFTVTIAAAPLAIAPASLPAATAGTAYSASFSATGGVPPYTWSASGLPTGLTLSSGGALSGTVSAPTTATVTVTVKDSTGATASKTYTLTVGLPPTPSVSLTGLPATSNPASQSTLQIGLGSAYPVAVTVNLTLTFAPASGADDPTVQFATGGRTAQLTIPAGSTVTLTGIGVQTGTVAGTITITAQLLAGSTDITPHPAPTATIVINAAPPVISSVTAAASSGGFTVTVIGYATTRSITSAIFTFTPAAGVNLQSSSVTVSVSSLFSAWYSSSTSTPFGSQFLYTQPFTVQGTGAIASVTVTLVNANGNSTTVSATIP